VEVAAFNSNTFFSRYRRRKTAVIGLAIFIIELIIFFVLPLIIELDPNTIGRRGFNAPPSSENLLGTDPLGRDNLSRLIIGGRTSLTVGLCAVAISFCIGLVLGLLAGYYRGLWESIVMRLVDIFMSFPAMVLALCMVAVVGPSMRTVIFVIGIIDWTAFAKLVYGNVLRVRSLDYVEASRVYGSKSLRIIFRDVLPNSIAPLWMLIAFRLSHAILVESGLSFLGAGVQAPQASWGNIISAAQSLVVLTYRPWIWIPPGICIIITVIGINFIGEGIRDALDPKNQL